MIRPRFFDDFMTNPKMANHNLDTKASILNQCLRGIASRDDRLGIVPEPHAAWICKRLAWHKVLPLAAALQDPRTEKCPAVATALRAVMLQNMAREEFYHNQAIRVFTALEQAGIGFMPFKGPFWGTQLYDAYHWRHIGDIDLLMTKTAAQAAADVLIAEGYRPHALEGSPDAEFAARGELALLPAASMPNDVPVELHWDLMPSPRFLRKRFLLHSDIEQSLGPGHWRGLSFKRPAPEIQLLYYLLHATCQHQFMRFVHITTIVHFLEAFPGLDWRRILALAAARGAMAPLHYALRFAHAFHPLPADARRAMERSIPRLLSRLLAMALRPGHVPLSTPRKGKTRRNLFRAAMSL
jgi:hypothetical protein